MTEALLVMDVQNGIVDRFDVEDAYLDRVVAAVERAEQAGVLVVLVRVAFSPGHPEVSARNKSFSALRSSMAMVAGDPATEPVPRLLRGNGEVVVTKKRVSAFAGSDLELVLRSHDVTPSCSPASPPAASCCRRCARAPTATTGSSCSRTCASTPTRRSIAS